MAGDENDDLSRRVEHREGHGNAMFPEFLHPVRHHPAGGFVQTGAVGKQRGCMTVVPHPEERQIKTRETFIQKTARLEKLPQVRLVFFR